MQFQLLELPAGSVQRGKDGFEAKETCLVLPCQSQTSAFFTSLHCCTVTTEAKWLRPVVANYVVWGSQAMQWPLVLLPSQSAKGPSDPVFNLNV